MAGRNRITSLHALRVHRKAHRSCSDSEVSPHTVLRGIGIAIPPSAHASRFATQQRGDQGASVTSLLRGKGKRKMGSRKRLTWAALVKRTYKIDVLTCSRCGGPMTLVHVALGPAEIQTTLIALGLSPRAPPIAPARQTGVFGSFDDGPTEPWPSN
jgi:hypothetical protein